MVSPSPPGHADLNFVIALIKEGDALTSRATKWLKANGQPRVTLATGIELLLWCRKHRLDPLDTVARVAVALPLEEPLVLATAASIMAEEGIKSPFDAIHLALALHRGEPLVTADERLWRTPYPTERF